MISKEQQKQHLIDMMREDEKLGLYDEEPKQETSEEAAEKLAMDKLKNKWEHLYIFGYPQKPFPTNYENDLNNVKVGLYEGAKWQEKRRYSETEVYNLLEKAMKDCYHEELEYHYDGDYKNLKEWFQQFKKK